MLGASALVIAAGCASAPSQQTRGTDASASTRVGGDLQARSSGVFIQKAPDGQVRVSLSSGPTAFGATSFTPQGGTEHNPKPAQNVPLASAEPLYLLDGVPYNPGPGGLLIGINPDDIASIKALKDPAELSLYGMRGGNGVISITTKKLGAKSDSTKR
ncbi:MAG TPA: TonB-dependent receptor plug domain-containing protein [Gemmatimonadaceae bacterium]|nr:TonB-dependent receptor plug domain-containing protein [Gemmatimonadaceae bacterium]